MRLHFWALGAFLVLCQPLRAQTASRRDTVVSYQDQHNSPVKTIGEAFYRVKAVPTDSLGGIVFRYSLDGWLVERQEYSNLVLHVAQGLDEEYYPQSKQRKVVCHFQNGKLNGELLSYHTGGQLKRREQYKDYISQGGQCYNEIGEPIAFVPYMVLPEFRGGLSALMQFIGNNLKYPKEALRAEMQSRVFVNFIIDKQGKVKEARVQEPGFPLLDAEALRVVNLLNKWKPGQKEGEKEDVSFTLPINFKIQ